MLGIYNGLQRGGVAGYGGAALSAADMYGRLPGTTAIPGVGPVSDLFGIYNGIQQGGVAGYGSAALDAYQLYGAAQTAGLIGGGSAAAGAAGAGGAAAGAVAGGDAAAAGGGAAAGAGAATAVALPLAVEYYGYESKPVTLNSTYWSQLNNELTGKGTNNATYNTEVDSTQQRDSALQELFGMAQSSADMGGGHNVTGGDISQGEWAFLASQGITPQNLQQQYLTANQAAYQDTISNSSGASGAGAY